MELASSTSSPTGPPTSVESHDSALVWWLTNRRGIMPCIRCGRITVKLCTCSIEQAREALSAWSEVELQQAINTLKTVLDSKQTEARGVLSMRRGTYKPNR